MDRTAEGVLKALIESIEYTLEELNGTESDPFCLGQRYAYVECLEIIQQWEKAASAGLDYVVEDRFPL